MVCDYKIRVYNVLCIEKFLLILSISSEILVWINSLCKWASQVMKSIELEWFSCWLHQPNQKLVVAACSFRCCRKMIVTPAILTTSGDASAKYNAEQPKRWRKINLEIEYWTLRLRWNFFYILFSYTPAAAAIFRIICHETNKDRCTENKIP